MQVPLVVMSPIGQTRPVLVWRDKASGRMLWEEITPDQYQKLGNPPARPINYQGTDGDWATDWRTNQARAEVRALYDTPGGEVISGGILALGGGRLAVCTDSRNNGHIILLEASDYTGTAPNITQSKPMPLVGVSLSAGVLTLP